MSEIPQDLNLKEYRQQQLEILAKDAGNSDAICELVCADALLCEENLKNFGPSWENPALCREILRYMPSIIEHPDKLNMAENVLARAAESLFDHPRLQLQLRMLQREAIEEQADQNGEQYEMGLDDLSQEILQLQYNIMAADRADFGAIVDNRAHLKHDPVEWTQDWEDVIEHAQREADETLSDIPRGMGFCFAWWSTLKDILLRKYNISWHSPGEMNPGVIFD